MRLLIVEDDPELAEALLLALQDESYAADLAADGDAADELVTLNEYDLVVLDWSIPPPSGIELVRQWRDRGLSMPILMLTGRRELEDRVTGLDTGADDYLTKPFSYAELLARVRSLLRRRDKGLPPLAAGDVEMDRTAHRVTVAGREVELSPKEFGVLEYLLAHPDKVISRQTLAEHVWDLGADPSSNLLDVIIYRVRKKIDGDRAQRLLETVKGIGYRLRSERPQ